MAFVTPVHLTTTPFTVAHVTRRARHPLHLQRVAPACMVDAPLPEDEPETPAKEQVIDVLATTQTMSSEELKRELYTLCGAVDRGFSATATQRRGILNTIQLLESSATCEAPLDDERLAGDWTLVYTNALDIVSLAVLPLASVAGVYQNVRARDNSFEVVNVVELEPPLAPVAKLFIGRTYARLEVTAVGKRNEADARRLDIAFERGRVRQETLAGRDLPAGLVPALSWPFPASPAGYILTTYLDDEIRIARAPPTGGFVEEGVFVLRKVAALDDDGTL